MSQFFPGIDLAQFWEPSEYGEREYTEPPPSAELIESVERELGYKLPASYLELAQTQNGGLPRKTCHRAAVPTTWARDHVAICGIFAVGRAKSYSLCGHLGSEFWPEEWGYPAIGVYFADCPSAGHDMLCLDYRDCGPSMEPKVVHIAQESDYKITPVAENFAAFICGLEYEAAFEVEGE